MLKPLFGLVAAITVAAPSLPDQVAPLSGNRADPLPLVAELSKGIIHGDRDDDLAHSALIRRFGRTELSLTCGPAVAFVRRELLARGIASRPVQLHAGGVRNGFDDGHVLLEIETKNGAVLVDVDQKRLFTVDGGLASSADVAREGFGAVTLRSFAPARVDPAFAFAAHVERAYADPRPWYARMFGRDAPR